MSQTGFSIFFRRTTPITAYTATRTAEPGDMYPDESSAQPPLNVIYDPYAPFDDSYDKRTHHIELSHTIERTRRRSDSEDEEKGDAIPLWNTARPSGLLAMPAGATRYGARPHRGYRQLSDS